MLKHMIAILLLAGTWPTALADIVSIPGSQKINPLFQAADLVCYGHVVSTSIKDQTVEPRGRGNVTVSHMKAIIKINDLYKGVAPTLITVSFVDRSNSIESLFPTLSANDDVLLFLTKAEDDYRFADPYLSLSRAEGMPVWNDGTTGILKLQRSLKVLIVQFGKPETLVRAMQLLQGIDPADPSISLQLSVFVASPNVKISAEAMALWLYSDKDSAIQALPDYMLMHSSDLDGLQLANITNQIGRVSGDTSIDAVQKLAASDNGQVRYASAYALRQAGDARSYPVLIKLLDDPDLDVAYQAVIALAEISGKGGDFGPNMAVFSQNPQRSKSLWKRWWAENSFNH